MLIKTVVDETFEGGKLYKSYCRADGSEVFQDVELNLAEMEYSGDFVKMLTRNVAEYYMHTVFTYDYESSSDAGDGRDDYYTEENDEQIDLTACIIKDGQFIGVMCECFDEQRFLLLDCPETVIHHPKNYGGKNYHFYRKMQFMLIKK